MTMFQCPSDILIVYSSMKNATGEMLQHCDERGWPKQGEEHVAKVLSKCGYPTWTIDRVKQDIVEKSLKDEANKAKNTRGNHKGMIVVPYVKGLSEAFARILKSHGIAQLTVLTKRYGTLWFIRRTRSRMKRRPNWSIVSLARTALALMLERQAGSSVWGSRNTRKKWTLSQLVHRPEPPGRGRAV